MPMLSRYGSGDHTSNRTSNKTPLNQGKIPRIRGMGPSSAVYYVQTKNLNVPSGFSGGPAFIPGIMVGTPSGFFVLKDCIM